MREYEPTGYTTVDPSEGEQAKPEFPDPVAETARRCAEIALAELSEWRDDDCGAVACVAIADRIAREFGLEEQA